MKNHQVFKIHKITCHLPTERINFLDNNTLQFLSEMHEAFITHPQKIRKGRETNKKLFTIFFQFGTKINHKNSSIACRTIINGNFVSFMMFYVFFLLPKNDLSVVKNTLKYFKVRVITTLSLVCISAGNWY